MHTNQNSSSAPATLAPTREGLRAGFRQTRQLSVDLTKTLSPEDQQVQSMPDVSPTKWHLGHCTWFFETFLLVPNLPGYEVFHPMFNYLFNSYYEAIGDRQPRPKRGLISRPSIDEVLTYRRHVDEGMAQLLEQAPEEQIGRMAPVIELGIHHEQQHQELILTDIKHVLSCNPMGISFMDNNRPPATDSLAAADALQWYGFEGGVKEIGADNGGFCYDNETPRHRVYLEDFQLASRAVTNGEFLEFLQDGAYDDPTLWLSDGWYTLQAQEWRHPLYWQCIDGEWWEFTLNGLAPLELDAPVTHVSYFESEAYAKWRGKRLPTEEEWEIAGLSVPPEGRYLNTNALHPRPANGGGDHPGQMFGDVWEWTLSPYTPYPGFKTAEGAVGEYNGKFMCNQMVLRGGSCATPQGHMRPSYRNFFPPDARWQFSGIRMADDA